jgi:hypothetical protein
MKPVSGVSWRTLPRRAIGQAGKAARAGGGLLRRGLAAMGVNEIAATAPGVVTGWMEGFQDKKYGGLDANGRLLDVNPNRSTMDYVGEALGRQADRNNLGFLGTNLQKAISDPGNIPVVKSWRERGAAGVAGDVLSQQAKGAGNIIEGATRVAFGEKGVTAVKRAFTPEPKVIASPGQSYMRSVRDDGTVAERGNPTGLQEAPVGTVTATFPDGRTVTKTQADMDAAGAQEMVFDPLTRKYVPTARGTQAGSWLANKVLGGNPVALGAGDPETNRANFDLAMSRMQAQRERGPIGWRKSREERMAESANAAVAAGVMAKAAPDMADAQAAAQKRIDDLEREAYDRAMNESLTKDGKRVDPEKMAEAHSRWRKQMGLEQLLPEGTRRVRNKKTGQIAIVDAAGNIIG